MADIRFVQIQVDEVAQAAVVLKQVPLEPGMGSHEAVQDLAHRIAGQLDAVLAGGETPQRGWNGNGHRHMVTPR